MFITTSFANDLSFLQWVIGTWQAFSVTLSTVAGLGNTLLNQHLVPTVIEKAAARGGNSLGLDPSHPVVISMLSLTWDDAADDNRVMTAATVFIDLVEQEAKRRGVHSPFIYLNYANRGQKVISGYGAATQAKLRGVSRKYDPAGVFQSAVPGGFKLWP
jgi:hypothetical protein